MEANQLGHGGIKGMSCFNRWGSIVYQPQPYDNTWKGTLMDTGQNLPAGTYYYIIRLDMGEGQIRYGQVTIIR